MPVAKAGWPHSPLRFLTTLHATGQMGMTLLGQTRQPQSQFNAARNPNRSLFAEYECKDNGRKVA